MRIPHPVPRTVLAAGLLVAAATANAAGPPPRVQDLKLPDTAAARLMGEWLDLCARPDPARMTEWVAAHLSTAGAGRMPATARAADMVQACTSNGGFDAVAVANSDPMSIALKLRGRETGGWFEVLLITNESGELDRSGIMPALPEEASLPASLTDEVIAKEVRQTVERLSKAGLFSGIVTVARGTGIIASASGGYANRAQKTPITGASRFTLASMGKMFTAAAIGQLVDQKKLATDDTVGKFFPDYPNKAVRDKVTIAMLLSHTSGMGDFLDKRTPAMMKEGVHRAAEFMPLYDHDEPQFAPGSDRSYSNAGLALAGAIIEKVSGESYPDYLRKHVFEPAGMKHSSANSVPRADAGLVTPYTRDPSGTWQVAEGDIGSPAGGAISTADDLIRFADALRSGKLVSKAWYADMVTPHGPPGNGGDYGYAIGINDIYGRTVVGHNGGFPGVSTHLFMVQDSPYTVVVLANQDPPAEAYAGLPVVALMVERSKRDN
ncbi:MAG TPA: serine hydrolase domain-containing protein [Dokdonella sp.]|jgi:D-alanyl-D-alanine carboxypeptidase|nr:serine hydrolase domain-containing protein [Dokdonella sp.]